MSVIATGPSTQTPAVTPGANDAPVFVVGSPRCGTHLMRYCLNRHSRLHVAFETSFFRKVYGNRALIPERELARHADKLIAKLYRSGDPTRDEYLPLRAELTARVAREARSYRDVANIVFGEFARQRGKVRWGEKTPFHVLYVKQILTVFPEARIVCMDRDVRAVAASFLKSRHLPNDVLLALAHYRICARARRRWADRMLHVRYEDFVDAPEPVLRRVCEHIDEAFEPAMLQPGMRDSSYGGAVMEFDAAIGIERGSRDRWRQVLSPEQTRFVEWMSGPSWRGAPRSFLRGALGVYRREARLAVSVLKSALGYENVSWRGRGRWA